MVSLWGSKNNDEEQLDDGSTTPRGSTEDTRRPPSRRSYERREREADERTRLLPAQPRPPHSDGYLDPDDPAVSHLFLLYRLGAVLTARRCLLTTSGPSVS
jgi:hypothetical protein